ncbi:MAG: hypothetical protein AABX05_03890, partial [Nanoarchaeota archaeon]
MVKIEMGTYTCSRCGKKFEDSQRAQFTPLAGKPGRMCRNCTTFVGAITQLEKKLLVQEAAIQKTDEATLKLIADILNRPETTSQDEEEVTALIGKLLSDESRVKNLLKNLRK